MNTTLQKLVPQHSLSRLVGCLARLRVGWLKNWIIARYIKHFGVDMSEAVISDYRQYPSFNAFFTRKLKPNARPIVQDDDVIISPADGFISQFGNINNQTLIQAKGINYEVLNLLGGDPGLAALFAQGNFFTVYLSPKDYHRVHMPLSGRLEAVTYLPGRLFSVNQEAVAHIPQLFTRNERVICMFQSEKHGKFALVLVGAMIVGSVSTVWQGVVMPQCPRNLTKWQLWDKEIKLERGQEMGHFEMGSTVILLMQPRRVHWLPELKINHLIKMGQVIGRTRKNK